jgi:histidyl-tRNA synthetase
VRRVKGTRDLLPPETAVWAAVDETARRVFGRYGYGEIRTPVLEETELFVRGVGEATDIVGKEMYSFTDKGGRHVTLRPESTASVARAYVENGLQQWPSPVKLFYIGPQFRYERPQKGRYRQFHQIGAEVFDEPHPPADVDLLLMLLRVLGELGFAGLVVRLNTVGHRPRDRSDTEPQCRQAYAAELAGFLERHVEVLGEDSRRRLATNPLRILDTKVPAERELVASAPALVDHLCPKCREHFASVRELLDRRQVAYVVDPKLVRGLDYYTRTVFEITSSELGAQDAIVGGGRYDGLVAGLGGPEASGLGFAIGEDRLIEILPESFRASVRQSQPAPVTVVLIYEQGEGGPKNSRGGHDLDLAEELRAAGISVVAELGDPKKKLGAALARAERRGSRYVLLLGSKELEDGDVAVKDLQSGEQKTVPRGEIVAYLEDKR